MWLGIVIAIAIPLLAAVYGLMLYNQLVGLRNRCRNAFSEIDIQLKRRRDLISRLVEIAKGYMAHERETLEAVAAARSIAEKTYPAAGLNHLANAENALGSAINQLLARVESYPDLKANTSMAALMEELTTTENRIAFARQAYNDAVMFFNTAAGTLPCKLIASPLGFQQEAFFILDDPDDKQTPAVSTA